jgi:hypothetical protein
MGTDIRTQRVQRTWMDKLRLWRRAYQTKINDKHREAIGRGPSPEKSQQAALRRWVEDVEQPSPLGDTE